MVKDTEDIPQKNNYDFQKLQRIGIDQMGIKIDNIIIQNKEMLVAFIRSKYKVNNLFNSKKSITVDTKKYNLPRNIKNMHINNHNSIINISLDLIIKDKKTDNLYNYTYAEYSMVIKEILQFFECNMGIKSDMDNVLLEHVEINKNYYLDNPITYYYKYFEFLFFACRNGHFKYTDRHNQKSTRMPNTVLTFHAKTSKSSSASHFKIYDKVEQLINTSPVKSSILEELKYINIPYETIIRIEFTIGNPDSIQSHLHSTKWTDLSQSNITEYYNKQILCMLDKYNKKVKSNTESVISLHFNQKRHNYKDLVLYICDREEIEGELPFIFDKEIFKKALNKRESEKKTGTVNRTCDNLDRALSLLHRNYNSKLITTLLMDSFNPSLFDGNKNHP